MLKKASYHILSFCHSYLNNIEDGVWPLASLLTFSGCMKDEDMMKNRRRKRGYLNFTVLAIPFFTKIF